MTIIDPGGGRSMFKSAARAAFVLAAVAHFAAVTEGSRRGG